MHDHETSRNTEDFDALRHDRDRLLAQLEACRHDLRQARTELASARKIQESLTEQLHAGGDAAQTRLAPAGSVSGAARTARKPFAWPLQAWRRVTLSADVSALRQDIQLLHDSEWFDAEWYLAEYPDVAQAGIDPAEHYLRFGVHEGRDPGPSFSSAQYLRDHPELIGTDANPLLHYLRSQHDLGA